jgi:hypothetical protein
MPGLPFVGGEDGPPLDDVDAFVPQHLPDPGPALADADVLTGEAHLAVHATVRGVFEERGVEDLSIGYNLADLNRDRRHPDAGLRYGTAAGGDRLWAELTPATAFCPGAHAVARGAFRALNAERERLDVERVRVRVREHLRADAIDEGLAALDAAFRETGTLPTSAEAPVDVADPPVESAGDALAGESLPGDGSADGDGPGDVR